MMTIKATLSDASKRLNNDEAAFEAQLLLQHVMNVNRAWLIAHQNDALKANIHAAYRALINRRINGEPIAYILGYREFYGLKLKVTPDTLIPRPDTETLVEAALAKIPQIGTTPLSSFRRKSESSDVEPHKKTLDSDFRRNDVFKILDLGTGSGAISLALAHSRPQAQVTATDASEGALKIAQENAQSLEIKNINFKLSDWFSALHGEKFDVIVSNPPYIEANDDHLKQGDLRFEPLSALASGKDGLDDIRTIVRQAKNHLNPHGWLMLEHGYNQAEAVASLFKAAGFSDISHAIDLQGIQRVTMACSR